MSLLRREYLNKTVQSLIHVDGMALTACRAQALRRTNFAAVYAPLPGNLTVQQNLRVFGLLCGAKGLSERIHALIRQFDLESFGM